MSSKRTQPPRSAKNVGSAKSYTALPSGGTDAVDDRSSVSSRSSAGSRDEPSKRAKATGGAASTESSKSRGGLTTPQRQPIRGARYYENPERGIGLEGRPMPSVSEPREFRSVGRRRREEKEEEGGENVLKEVGQFVRRHWIFLMSTFTLSVFACIVGSLVTFWRVGPQYEGYLVQKTADRVLQMLPRQDCSERVPKVLRQRAIVYQCLPKFRSQWQWFEEELGKIRQEQQNKYDELLKAQQSETEKINDSLKENTEKMTTHITTALKKLEEDLQDSFKKGLEQTESTLKSDIDSQTKPLKEKQEEIEKNVKLADQLMEIKGFLKIDSIGPVLVVLGVVEVLLALCVCALCGRGVASAASQPRQQGAAAAPSVRQQVPSINTNNFNVLCLCFRDSDETLARTLGSQILESCGNRRLVLRTFVVNTMEDVREITDCRAALVFVDPDEREMIVEDERYHIGQGLRRNAVQRLLDSGVEVFIVIFNDRRSLTMPAEQLYNPRLGQVDEHAQLKRLKRRDRVVSIKDKFHEHQSALIVREINTIFH